MSEPLFFQSGTTGLADVGYRFFDSAGDWVGARITAGVFETDALNGTYGVAAATIPATAKGVHWDSSGTPAVQGDEIFDTVGYATLGAALSAVHGSGTWESSGAGTGARTVTVTVDDNGSLLENATVRMVEGVNNYVVLTNASGVAVFQLDDATYTIAVSKAGYLADAGNVTSVIVNGDETVALEMNAVVIPSAPADPTKGTVYGSVKTSDASTKAGYEVTATLKGACGEAGTFSIGSMLIPIQQADTTDSNGEWSIDLYGNDSITPDGSRWTIEIPSVLFKRDVVVTSGQVTNVDDLIP